MLCRFGDDCKFSHLSPHEIDTLRNSGIEHQFQFDSFFFFLFLMDFVFVFLAQLEETFSFRLPIQLRGNKEPSIPEFLSKIENLLETKKTSGSCIKSATSVSSVVMTQENDS